MLEIDMGGKGWSGRDTKVGGVIINLAKMGGNK